MRKHTILLGFTLLLVFAARAQNNDTAILLRPDRVFDGENLHTNWVVMVQNNTIVAVGEAGSVQLPAVYKAIEL
jgi:hypothetical protein